jgi:hypothetical protein
MRAVRPNRHPAQLAMFAWTGYGGLTQLRWGPSTTSPTWELGSTNVTLNAVMIGAALLGLTSAILRDVWMSAGVELAGWFLMLTAYYVYLSTLLDAAQGTPTRTFAFILTGAVLSTGFWRIFHIAWDAYRIKRGVIVVAPTPEVIAPAAATLLATQLRDVTQEPLKGDQNSDREG